MKIIITSGVPGCGKSTWAKKFVEEHPEYKRINRDDLRAMVNSGEWSKEKEKYIRLTRDMMMKLALMEGYNVVLDETFLIPQAQQEILEIISAISSDLNKEIDVEIKFIDTPVEECIRRDNLREGTAHVGEKVIRDYYDKYVAKKTQK